MSKIELVGESGNDYLFAYEADEDTPEQYRENSAMRLSFVYVDDDGEEEYKGCTLLGSMLAHNPYWDEPSRNFTEPELERIALMLPEVTCTLPRTIGRQIVGLRLMKERTHGDMKNYVFAFTREDENKNVVPMHWGFMYSKNNDEEVRYGICRLEALYAHIRGFEDAHTLFTDDEKQRINRLEITGKYK